MKQNFPEAQVRLVQSSGGLFEVTVDGQLVFCAHPMYWPVVGYEFDLRNCEDCDVFKSKRRDADPPG